MDNTVVISTPPHVKSKRTTRGIMADVCIALLPAAIAGIVYFGVMAFVTEIVSVAACVLTEFVYYFIANGGFGKKCKNAGAVCKKWLRQFDLTSVVTGLILALIPPPAGINEQNPNELVGAQWYEVIVGAVLCIALVKMFFGGTGKNLVNPAAAGRVIMFISFAATMTKYIVPQIDPVMIDSEVLTGATNLSGSLLTGGGNTVNPLDLFLGTGVKGCIGETCKLAIIIGYLYLCIRKVIKWWQPVLFLGVFGFFAVLLSGFKAESYTFDISLFLPHILSGGVMFAAVFMFTDYVTSPKGVIGQLVYYIGGAILLALLRYFTQLEVASFVILIMNILVPLIDRYCIRKPFGYVKPPKAAKKEGK